MSKHKPHKKTSAAAKEKHVNAKTIASVKKIKFNRNFWYAILAISIFSFVLYGNTLKNDYALDDAIVMTSNQFTQNGTDGISDIFKYDTFVGFWMTSYPGKTAEQIQQEKKLVAGGRYRPLSLVTFAAEVEYFGKNVKDANGKVLYRANSRVSHFINILLYLLTTILLYLILMKLFPPKENAKWYFSFPFLAALLFLAHPIHTEAVANIKGRDEIMTLLGSLGALWFSIKYFDRKKFYFLILSSLSLFLGLLSKENAITFLAVIPITLYYFTDNSIKKILISITPLVIVAGMFLLIRSSVLQPNSENEEALIKNSKPEYILVQNVSYPEAEIIWVDKSAESWNVKVSTKAINPLVEKGDVIDCTSNEKPFNVSGLIKEKGYYLYVQSIYNDGGVSSWGNGYFYPEIMNNPFIYTDSQKKYATIFYTLWVYVKLLVYPHPLTYDYYPHQIEIISATNPKAFVPFLLYLMIGIFAVWGMIKKKDMFSYGIWLYLIPLSVVSNIFFPVGTFMNERFVFISSIGFCLILAWLISKYLPKIIKETSTLKYVTGFVMIVILGLYSTKTISRNRAWENDFVLFSTDSQTSTNSAKSNCSAGGKLIEEAQKPENKNNKAIHDQMCVQAISYLEKSLSIYPDYVDASNLLGNANYEYNLNVAKSLEAYANVLRTRPYHSIAIRNSRIVIQNTFNLLPKGETPSTPDEIIKSCRMIIDVKPEIGEAYYLMGVLFGKYKNELDSAFLYLEKANNMNFNKSSGFYKDMGVAYGMKGLYDKAIQFFTKAIELDPNDAQTYFNLGVTYQQIGDIPNANLYLSKSEELKQKQAAQ